MPQLDTVTFFNQALSLFAFFFVSLPLLVFHLSRYTSLVSVFRSQGYAGLAQVSEESFPADLLSPASVSQPGVTGPVGSGKLEGLKRSLIRELI